jgi:methylated-DNA-[protein]-cysteine S-methyltransferase
MKNFRTYLRSRIGTIEIAGTEEAVTSVNFVDEKQRSDSNLPVHIQKCRTELDEYFKGRRKHFTVQLKIGGTDFQKKVWRELMKIPYGKTVSYKDVAQAIGNPKGVRAVGGAVGSNAFGIVIPCHRVIGASGDLTGFGGGLWRKEWLLSHESRHS